MNTFDTLSEILKDKFDVEDESITPDANFDTMDLDSLSQVELGDEVKEAFGVALTDDELQNVDSLSSIVNLIDSKQ